MVIDSSIYNGLKIDVHIKARYGLYIIVIIRNSELFCIFQDKL